MTAELVVFHKPLWVRLICRAQDLTSDRLDVLGKAVIHWRGFAQQALNRQIGKPSLLSPLNILYKLEVIVLKCRYD